MFGLTPDQVIARTGSSAAAPRLLTLGQSIRRGALGFGLASLLVFATVAFGERWMYRQLGLTGAYVCWALLFVAAGGGALSRLVIGPGHLVRFYFLFSLAFLAYAAGWIGAYFTMPNKVGEWLGSLVGTVLLGLVLAWAFGAWPAAPKLMLVLFVTHSLGYFLGDWLNNAVGGRWGMMLWGAAYGLGLGAGLGAALYLAQAPVRALLREPKSGAYIARND